MTTLFGLEIEETAAYNPRFVTLQGSLPMLDATQERQRAATKDRLTRACYRFADGVKLLFSVRRQEFHLPALAPNELYTALESVRGAISSLQQIEKQIEDAMSQGQ